MNFSLPHIGVLALQGAVLPHKAHIEACNASFQAVKTAEQIASVDALILPGGESTTMLKLINRFNLWDTLKSAIETKPAWGICAGAILLAETVTNPTQESFSALPMTVRRNGYGRQLDSSLAKINGYTVSFIRAPIIEHVTKDIEVIATHNDTPVWVKKGRVMATTFHPELTFETPSPMHQEFINMVK